MMDAANRSSPPAVATADLHHDDPVQRLKTMHVSSATGPQTPLPLRKRKPMQTSKASTAPSPPTSAAATHNDAFLTTLSTLHLPSPAPQPDKVEHGHMGEVSTLARQVSDTSDDPKMPARRPSTPRAQTDPQPDTFSTLYQQLHAFSTLCQPPRNQPHSSRSHLRTQSVPNPPPMTRAHSLPTVMQPTGNLTLSSSPMPLARPASPLRSPQRVRSPRSMEPRSMGASTPERYGSGIRPASTGSFEGAPGICDISEDAELELTPRAGTTVSSLYSSTGSLSRRRRPASPLYQVSVPFGMPPTSTPSVGTPTSGASSPLLAPSRFNENYPPSLASSSIPSTPTSMRSRSPSISSLETIEDSPDAEEEAIEEYRINRLKAAADREDGGDQRRSSLDVPEGRGRSLAFGKRDSRKRWSVCGAERRGDLDLETIWED